jgi:hypothetical protein
MSLLVVAEQVDLYLLDALCDSDSCYTSPHHRVPRSAWITLASLPSKNVEKCRLAVEAAEMHLMKIDRLLQGTSHRVREWWQAAHRHGGRIVTVRVPSIYRVRLPAIPLCNSITLEPMQTIDIMSGNWKIKARVGLGYLLQRGMMEFLRKPIKTTKKGSTILKMTELMVKCLATGKRLFEIDDSKEMKALVRAKWGWRGVFSLREDLRNERCVIILFDPVRVIN